MKDHITLLLAIAGFVLLLFFLKGETILTVTQVDAQGKLVTEQTFDTIQAQSLFGLSSEVIAQAASPVDADQVLKSVFKARVKNPFPEKARLLQVTITKNGKEIKKQLFTQEINKEYLYVSDEINLEGLEAQKNSVIMRFEIEYEGERKTQYFEYNYYYLNNCERDTDCEDPTMKCDLGNQARFSTSKERYCVQTCISHDYCPDPEQICINGFCGY